MDLTGKTLDRYRILRKLGSGGMAVVYLAEDSAGKRMAVKALHTAMTHRADIMKRFRREAELGQRLDHPQIVNVYGLKRDQGHLFIVMEYMEGGTLLDRIKKQGPLTWNEAVSILQQIGEALSYAHAHGVIHRDVKPSNILFDEAGSAHLADFGVARDIELETITNTGTQPGTYHYMAPEQIKGERVDAKVDQFALATVFYQMLSGELPYSATNSWDLQNQIINEAPATLPSDIDVPLGIMRVLEKAQQKSPERRYANIRAFTDAVAALSFSDISSPRYRNRKLSIRKLVGIVVVLFVLLFVGGAVRSFFAPSTNSNTAQVDQTLIATDGVAVSDVSEQLPAQTATPSPQSAITQNVEVGPIIFPTSAPTSNTVQLPTPTSTTQKPESSFPPTPTLIPTTPPQSSKKQEKTQDVSSSQPSLPEATADLTEPQERHIKYLSPADGSSSSSALTFVWEPDFKLSENELFELIFWKEGDNHENGWGPVPASRDTSYLVHFNNGLDWLVPGIWHWGVYLVERDVDKDNPGHHPRIQFLGGGRTFHIEDESGTFSSPFVGVGD